MKIEQIYTGCLAQGAYYISSNGEAAIIDPLHLQQQTTQNQRAMYQSGLHWWLFMEKLSILSS